MKFNVDIKVSLKDGVLDPQGKTIAHALINLGFKNIVNVNTGKIFKVEIDAESESNAKKVAEEIANKLLANSVIEKYDIQVQR